MFIKSIELNQFRNYENLNLQFDNGTNILYGDNAQGKTNVLEAVCVSGTTKSHRGSKDKEMIRFGMEESHIKTVVEKKNMEYQIDTDHLSDLCPECEGKSGGIYRIPDAFNSTGFICEKFL